MKQGGGERRRGRPGLKAQRLIEAAGYLKIFRCVDEAVGLSHTDVGPGRYERHPPFAASAASAGQALRLERRRKQLRGFSAANRLSVLASERSRAFGSRRVSERGVWGVKPSRWIFDN